MKKLPVVLATAAICSVGAFASIPSVYAYEFETEYGTPERAAEIAQNYLTNKNFDNSFNEWCVEFAITCIQSAGGVIPGIEDYVEGSTTSAIVKMYDNDHDCYHSWEEKYWHWDGKENPKKIQETDYTPQVGDLVFFDKYLDASEGEIGPGPDHTGLVVAVEGTGMNAIITTIEGNMGDTIITAKYQNRKPIEGYVESETVIIGFGTPKYPNKSTSSNSPNGTNNNILPESPITSSEHSRQRAIEQARLRISKNKRPADYSKTTIGFVDEVLNAAGAKSFYDFPDIPHVTDFVKEYQLNGAYYEYSSSYVPRVGDVVVLENNGNPSDGADQLGIVSGANFENDKKEVYIIKYDPQSDTVCDSVICSDTIIGYCIPFYEYDDLGDVTYDGHININDVAKIMDFVFENETNFSAYMKLCADINKNEIVNRIDISELQQKLSRQIILEPEIDLSNIVGKKEDDCITATVEDEIGYMVYGPYINGLADGNKEVTFRLKTDNNTADNEVVARIEVSNAEIGEILASKEIRRKDFLTPDAYQDFLLEYESSNISDRIEYRVFYFKKAFISVDSVTVKDINVKTNMEFEAETDLYSQIREKDSDGKYGKSGIEAVVTDTPAYLAYGPYIDKLALGSFRADFSLKVNDNTLNSDVIKIEVYNTTKDRIITYKTLKCTDFEKSNFTQVFSLYFNNTQLNDVYEFRAFYIGNSETIIDKVSVVHIGKNISNGFLPEDMEASTGCKREENAICLSKNGDIVYGPYTDKISLGSNTALFKATITGDGNPNDVVALFDVYTPTNDSFIAKKEIKRSEISPDGYYRLNFSIPVEYVDHKLEFRVSATGMADIRFEKVFVISDKNVSKDISSALLNTTSRTAIMKGVDVSNPGQGRNIDWDVLKNSDDNIDFAIIRVGDWITTEKYDLSFEHNYSEAKRVGMKIGGYWYSRCLDVEQARIEAHKCIEYIKGKEFEFPIYMDFEEKVQLALGEEKCTEIVVAFCEEIKAAGYTPGLYTTYYGITTCIDASVVEKYALWIAHWENQLGYNGPVGMWQYTDTGSVKGISANVDKNECFVDYPSILK